MSKHLLLIVTSAITADRFLRGQIEFFEKQGHRVSLVASFNEQYKVDWIQSSKTAVFDVSIEREISPLHDFFAFLHNPQNY